MVNVHAVSKYAHNHNHYRLPVQVHCLRHSKASTTSVDHIVGDSPGQWDTHEQSGTPQSDDLKDYEWLSCTWVISLWSSWCAFSCWPRRCSMPLIHWHWLSDCGEAVTGVHWGQQIVMVRKASSLEPALGLVVSVSYHMHLLTYCDWQSAWCMNHAPAWSGWRQSSMCLSNHSTLKNVWSI